MFWRWIKSKKKRDHSLEFILSDPTEFETQVSTYIGAVVIFCLIGISTGLITINQKNDCTGGTRSSSESGLAFEKVENQIKAQQLTIDQSTVLTDDSVLRQILQDEKTELANLQCN